MSNILDSLPGPVSNLSDIAPATGNLLPTKGKRGKNEQILAGCARLAARQSPGECFSAREIARECGVHHESIDGILKVALARVAKRLHEQNPELFREMVETRAAEVFDGLTLDREAKTGRSRIVAACAQPKRRRRGPRSDAPSLCEIAKDIAHDRGSYKWGAARDRQATYGLPTGSVKLAQRGYCNV